MTKWNELEKEEKIEVLRYNFVSFSALCYLIFAIFSIFGVLISTLLINSNLLHGIALPLLIISIILTGFFAPIFLLKTYELIKLKKEVFEDGN